MIFTETHTIILELWDRLSAELERLETKVQNGTASQEEHDWLCEYSDTQGALIWAIQGKPISVSTLAVLIDSSQKRMGKSMTQITERTQSEITKPIRSSGGIANAVKHGLGVKGVAPHERPAYLEHLQGITLALEHVASPNAYRVSLSRPSRNRFFLSANYFFDSS